MDTTLRILITLSAVFFTEGVYIPYGKRQDGLSQSSECNSGISQCLVPFDRSVVGRMHMDLRGIFDNIDQVCQAHSNAIDCIQPYKDHCEPFIQEHIDGYAAAGQFFCSERGRSLLGEFQSSVCYDEPQRLFESWPSYDICLEQHLGSNPPIAGHCLSTTAQFQCLEQAAREICGEAAGQIAAGYSDSLLPILTAHCSDDIPGGEFLRRAY